MNTNIKYLLESLPVQGFDLSDYSGGEDILEPEDIRAYTYSYHPKTNKELKECVKKLLEKGEKNLNIIDVSNITDFSNVFENLDLRGVDISDWDVSNGEIFSSMFADAKQFNSDLSKWDVGNGERFYHMFYNCRIFNSNISKWNVSSGRNFKGMFYNCHKFNQDLSKWNVSSGLTFSEMFYNCKILNFKISSWKIKDPEATGNQMFNGAHELTAKRNKNIAGMDITGIVNMFINNNPPNIYIKNFNWELPDGIKIKVTGAKLVKDEI